MNTRNLLFFYLVGGLAVGFCLGWSEGAAHEKKIWEAKQEFIIPPNGVAVFKIQEKGQEGRIEVRGPRRVEGSK